MLIHPGMDLLMWVIELLIQDIRSKMLIHLVIKQVEYLWVSHWIIHARDFFKNADSSSNETSEGFMIESLNHSFKRFV